MLKALSVWAIAIAILSLCNTILGAPPEECVEDDILLSLREWIIDADSFCRTRLAIDDVYITVPGTTSRTTVTTHLITTLTKGGITTVPTATVTLTVSDFSSNRDVRKRMPGPAEAQFYEALPFAEEVANGTADDALISQVSSGCECLYLETNTVQIVSTPKFTRTLTAASRLTINKYSATVTSGIATEFVTITQLPLTSTRSITLIPTPSSTRILPTRSISRSVLPLFNSTSGSLGSSGVIRSSATIIPGTTIPITTASSVSGLPTRATGTVVNDTNFTTRFSTLTVRRSTFSTPSIPPTGAFSTRTPFASLNATTIRSSIFPSLIPSQIRPIGSFNSTNLVGPTGNFPTLNITLPSITASNSFNASVTATPLSNSSALPSRFPTLSINSTNEARDLLRSCSALGLISPITARILPPLITSLTLPTKTVTTCIPPSSTIITVETSTPPPTTVISVKTSIRPPSTVTFTPSVTVTSVQTSIQPPSTVTSFILTLTTVRTSIPPATTVTATSIRPPTTVTSVIQSVTVTTVRTSIPPPITVTSFIESVTVIRSTAVLTLTSTITSTVARTIRATPT